jgi:hypothetical protein
MKEEEIRPEKLFDELLRLSKEDIDIYFSDVEYKRINCPACNQKGEFIFNKDGFNYEECRSCKTIYVSPRPTREAFDRYYTASKSTKFWATTFYKATEKNRREKLWKPKAKLIFDKIKQFLKNTEIIVDIGGGYGIFMEEFLKLMSLKHYIVEPSKYLAGVCRRKGLHVIEKFLEQVKKNDFKDGVKTFVSFELFEHLYSPGSFLDALNKIMESGEIFIFTTLSGIGLDIQTLWQDSKAIAPPMHLNFFNPKSIKILLNRTGFEPLNVSTPGKLDIDIMENNKDKIKDRFWRNFLEYASSEEKNKMQKFLSDNLLSSHMMVVCRKL